MDLDDYKTELVGSLSQAWELARAQVKKAQQKQKYYDLLAKESKFQQGDRVFMYMPSEKKRKGKAHKFARPFHGPYRVIELTANGAKVVPVDKPYSPIFVALDRVCHGPDELPPVQSWPSRRQGKEYLTDTFPDPVSDDENVESLFEGTASTPSLERMSETFTVRGCPDLRAGICNTWTLGPGHLNILCLILCILGFSVCSPCYY